MQPTRARCALQSFGVKRGVDFTWRIEVRAVIYERTQLHDTFQRESHSVLRKVPWHVLTAIDSPLLPSNAIASDTHTAC